MTNRVTAQLAALVFVLGLVFGAAIAAFAHNATHYHGMSSHSLTLDGTNTAHSVGVTGCTWYGFTYGWRRSELHSHFSRNYPSAPWVENHARVMAGQVGC